MHLQSVLGLFLLTGATSAIPTDKVACALFCPRDEICVTDPDRPKQSFCVKPVMCGGLAVMSCKNKTDKCVDDPRDDCDPEKGGADCSGVCIPGISITGY
jgi:hypothetical protein